MENQMEKKVSDRPVQKKKVRKSYFSRTKISIQMVLVYFCAVFMPMCIIGSFLMTSANRMQKDYYSDMLQASNAGISQTLYEITTQIYTISDSIVYNDNLIAFLNGEYASEREMMSAAANTTLLDKYAAKYAGVDEIYVYIDREDMVNYGQFYKVTDEIASCDWYKKALDQYMPFWCAYESVGLKGTNMRWNLVLVRKMVLVGGEREAVILIKVRDSYLASRLSNSRYSMMFAIDDQTVAFSNLLSYYGKNIPIDIDYSSEDFSFTGNVEFEGQEALADVATLKLSKSSNKLYLVAFDTEAMSNIKNIQRTNALVIILALAITLFVLILYSKKFTGQVHFLRNEMGKASRGQYEEMAAELSGSEEFTEAFEDLQKMVRDIQQMEAEQYETRIREQNIRNEQQRMEFKMLSNQINPHFLYNTLETIRMKALTAGDTEVANATKLLGKSMRYVLENTGTKDTTLQKEIDHILIYLQIQKLRFGERINYEIDISPEVSPEKCRMLPILLQPVVENAIVHGLEGRENDGKVIISISEYEETLYINVTDNGIGIEKSELEQIRKGLEDIQEEIRTENIALYNINRRIKLSYGEKYGISVDSAQGEGTTVRIKLPVIMN